MKLHLNRTGANIIHAFTASEVVVGETRYSGSIILTADAVAAWAPRTFADITPASLQVLADKAAAGDIVIVGVGAAQPPITAAWYPPFVEKGAALEIMSMSAACRTYNIVAGDGRGVIAGLVFSEAPA